MTTLFVQHHELIGASVRVECTDLTHLCGALYCIDPESDAVVLLRARDDSDDDAQNDWRVQILMGHSVRAIHRDDQATPSDSLESIRERVIATTVDPLAALDSKALQQRREQLCQLLRKVLCLSGCVLRIVNCYMNPT